MVRDAPLSAGLLSESLGMNAIVAPGAAEAASVTLSGSTALAGHITSADVSVKDLGKCLLPSPVVAHLGEGAVVFVGAAEKVLVDDRMSVIDRKSVV